MDTNIPRIILRRINESDYEDYLKLQKELMLPVLDVLKFSDTIIRKIFISMFKESRITYAIMTDDIIDFCGYCAVKNIYEEKPEIEIELFSRYRSKGIGYQALSNMMTGLIKQHSISCFIATVAPDNHVSQALMYKLGGVPAGIRKSIPADIPEKYIQEYERIYLGSLNNVIIKAAENFGVEPKTLLSHRLIFSISADSLFKSLKGYDFYKDTSANHID